MTLREAYELQKKELLAAKRELAKFRESSVPLSEKEGLEKALRKSERSNAALQKQYDELVDIHLADIRQKDRLMDALSEERARTEELTRQNEQLAMELAALRADMDGLRDTNRKLTARLNKDHTNSSLPSSVIPFRKKIHNSRIRSGKKPGAQPGHRGHVRKIPADVQHETVKLPAPACTADPGNAGEYYKTGKEIHKFVVDLQILVKVTDYCADEYRSRLTGRRVHAPFPAGVCNEMNYGSGLKAFAFLLNGYYNVPVLKVKELVSFMTDSLVSPSAGMISSLGARFSAATEAERMKIYMQLVKAETLYADATAGNVNGKRNAVFVSTDKDCVLYQARESKGDRGIEGTPVEKSMNTIVHDHDKTFYHYGVRHQECLAHVLRYLSGSVENEPSLTWNRDMQKLLHEIIHFAKTHPERRHAGDPQVRKYRKQYREILMKGKAEYKAHPPSKDGYRDGYNLCERMLEYMDSHLLFLSDPKVEWTNNISERALRKVKPKQRQAVVFRSASGLIHYCDSLTVIETARMRHRNPCHVVKAVFQNAQI